ncbi:MAG: hypothetical protein JO197_22470 [Acidobacteria bacterium]|nr:hypothetical protein [Acidobacteriota bacterium]MBV9478028.1 hypothetical protein [Acidobacteriota bacterium]
MNAVEQSIRRALPVLAEKGTIAPFVLLAWLIRSGVKKPDAIRAQRFVPLAFGRVLIEGMGVALDDTYVRVNHDGSREERTLSGEEFFTTALRIAKAGQVPAALFTPIALLSSEVQAVNAALSAGANAEDLVASPAVIEWPDETPAAPAASSRPWWKFWG